MKVTMEMKNLKTIFDACKNFVSKDSLGPAYQYIQLNFANGKCIAYALDGCKIISVVVPYTDGDEGTMLVPIIKLPKSKYVILSDEGDEIVFDFLGNKQTVRKIGGNFAKNPEQFLVQDNVNFRITFNPKYLKEALDSFKDEKAVVLNFAGPSQMCVIEGSANKIAGVLPIYLGKR
jgi:DNA polymerase III sliding clamp (beta) subunit (PCNA family)